MDRRVNIQWLLNRFLRKSLKSEQAIADETPLEIISGISRLTDEPLAIGYFGSNPNRKELWSSSFLLEKRASSQFTVQNAKGGRGLQKHHPDCDMLIHEAVSPEEVFDKQGTKALFLPNFMQTYIDTSEPIEMLVKRSRAGFKNAQRFIRKNNLSFKISDSPADQQTFYHQMYLPYLHKRVGDKLYEVTFGNIFSDLYPFKIIQLMMDDQWIAGGVIIYKHGQVNFGFLGVRDGAFLPVKQGALGALYYFACQENHLEGHNKLFLGGSPPFLTHPLTRHKIRMNAQLVAHYPYQAHELIKLEFLKNPQAMKPLLETLPLVSYDSTKGHIGHLWITAEKIRNSDEFFKEISLYTRVGITTKYYYILDHLILPDPLMKTLDDQHFIKGEME